MDCRVRRSYDFHSDHRLVVCRFKSPKSRVHRKTHRKQRKPARVDYSAIDDDARDRFLEKLDTEISGAREVALPGHIEQNSEAMLQERRTSRAHGPPRSPEVRVLNDSATVSSSNPTEGGGLQNLKSREHHSKPAPLATKTLLEALETAKQTLPKMAKQRDHPNPWDSDGILITLLAERKKLHIVNDKVAYRRQTKKVKKTRQRAPQSPLQSRSRQTQRRSHASKA